MSSIKDILLFDNGLWMDEEDRKDLPSDYWRDAILLVTCWKTNCEQSLLWSLILKNENTVLKVRVSPKICLILIKMNEIMSDYKLNS